MNPKIEKIREDIAKTETKINEANEYLKVLREKEKRLCDEELIKVMRGAAGKNGDVIALLESLMKNDSAAAGLSNRIPAVNEYNTQEEQEDEKNED